MTNEALEKRARELGFDRVWAYRFEPDGRTAVIAA